MRGEECRLMELFIGELDRCEVYEVSKALAVALHLYAIERRDRVIAEAREKEDREMYDSPTPPSREERIEKAVKKIEKTVSEVLCGEDNVADYDKNIRAILTELVGGKP